MALIQVSVLKRGSEDKMIKNLNNFIVTTDMVFVNRR